MLRYPMAILICNTSRVYQRLRALISVAELSRYPTINHRTGSLLKLTIMLAVREVVGSD